MKKLSALLLCILLMTQMLLLPVNATETQEPTMAPALPGQIMNDGMEFDNGLVTIMNGCRTIDAQVPLGTDARMLETAVSAFSYEINTGTVVYSYNPDLKLQPGTLTKIVASIVAIENGNLDDESDDMIDDAQLYFLFVKLAARMKEMYEPAVAEQMLEDYLADYCEPVPGAKERVRKVLRIMLTAWLAARMMQETEAMLSAL